MRFLRLDRQLESEDVEGLPHDIPWVGWGRDILVEEAKDAPTLRSALEGLGYTVSEGQPRSEAAKTTQAMRLKAQ